MRRLALTLVSLLLLACNREAVAPATVSAPRFAATSDWTRSSFFFEITVPVPCRGTLVRFHGEIPFMWHQVTTASGVYNYHYQIPPQTPFGPPYVGEEQGTGIVFLYKNGHPINESFHLAAGEIYQLNDRELYIAPNGDKLVAIFARHLTVNANGELVVDRMIPLGFECVFK